MSGIMAHNHRSGIHKICQRLTQVGLLCDPQDDEDESSENEDGEAEEGAAAAGKGVNDTEDEEEEVEVRQASQSRVECLFF